MIARFTGKAVTLAKEADGDRGEVAAPKRMGASPTTSSSPSTVCGPASGKTVKSSAWWRFATEFVVPFTLADRRSFVPGAVDPSAPVAPAVLRASSDRDLSVRGIEYREPIDLRSIRG